MKTYYKKDNVIGVINTQIKGEITRRCIDHYHVKIMTNGNMTYNDVKVYKKELTISKPK